MGWHEYTDLERLLRIRYKGTELLGKKILFTIKRDGMNTSLWLDDDSNPIVASHHQSIADKDISNRMMNTPEYPKIVQAMQEAHAHGADIVPYGELLQAVSPTKIEPRRKHIHWIIFDIWDLKNERYIDYGGVEMLASIFKIPIVPVVAELTPNSVEEILEKIVELKKWCRRHRREGVVGKNYDDQIFFKEKINLPDRPRVRKFSEDRLPTMPLDKSMRALIHAFGEVGEENWSDRKIAMPVIARHFATEAREHGWSTPRNMYQLYVETSIDDIR